MGTPGIDPSILQDFLTEAGELLEQLDRDLVALEETPGDPELLNQIFRALHTIKGSASFLALTNLVELAHAAESALNSARNRVFVVDRSVMDLLLQAVDVLKTHFAQLGAGEDLVKAPPALVADLTALGEGKKGNISGAAVVPASKASAPVQAPTPAATDPGARIPLDLPQEKADLLEFFVADVDQTLDQARTLAASFQSSQGRAEAGSGLHDLAETLAKCADFFGVDSLKLGASLLGRIGAMASDTPARQVSALEKTTKDLIDLLSNLSGELRKGFSINVPLAALQTRLERVATDEEPEETEQQHQEGASPADAAPQHAPSDHPADPATAGAAAAAKNAPGVEHTIRVEVGRLEALLNLVGELVLQKNRIGAISRRFAVNSNEADQELADNLVQSTGNLDRLTSDIQVAVMRTRMQPLDKLFGKYPRLIRDLARKTGKQMRLVIEGGDTEVDKSVIEELGDPMVHLLRNSADHGIEMPDERERAGKPPVGTLRLSASHEGSHVLIQIRDDGRGLNRDKIGAKAIQQGLITGSQLAAMSDREVYNIIFAPGFSTAEKVSDLSGRGVGMDVVRTNIEKIKGSVDLQSEPGAGTTILIKIPLTVAILTAMMVAVGPEIYAIPLHNILEIVKVGPDELTTVNGLPVMRLRQTVLPILNAGEVLGVDPTIRGEMPFAVVLSTGEQSVGVLVSGLIGQQQIVIKPLDSMVDSTGPVSGATVRDDGGVSLIIDVARLIQGVQQQRRGAHVSNNGRDELLSV